NHHAIDTKIRHVLEVCHRPQAASKLNGHVDMLSNPCNSPCVGAYAVSGAIEVYDVDPLCPFVLPALSGIQRVAIENRFAVVVAFDESDGMAATNIDGRIDNHEMLRLLQDLSHEPRRSRPACWLFSGWNCVPQILSRITRLANRWPYSVSPATTSVDSGRTS